MLWSKSNAGILFGDRNVQLQVCLGFFSPRDSVSCSRKCLYVIESVIPMDITTVVFETDYNNLSVMCMLYLITFTKGPRVCLECLLSGDREKDEPDKVNANIKHLNIHKELDYARLSFGV